MAWCRLAQGYLHPLPWPVHGEWNASQSCWRHGMGTIHWPFVWGIHRSHSLHEHPGFFVLFVVSLNELMKYSGIAVDLRSHDTHVTVMSLGVVSVRNELTNNNIHDDVIKWKHFPRNWPFVRGIHRSRWIPHTKASDAELWCFLWSASE